MDSLKQALLDGDQSRALAEASRLTAHGITSEQIVTEAIGGAMADLDGKCTLEQFNLLEIMLAGRAVTALMRYLFPSGSPFPARGILVVASLEGDVHDLGKNIFKTIMTGKGFTVVDCGRDCPVDHLVESAAESAARFVCISGLITTIIPQVRRVRQVVGERGLDSVRIIAGGAALKQSTPLSLNVDYVAESAFDGAHYIENCLESRS